MKKADNFDAKKWLVENKITTQSRIKEGFSDFGRILYGYYNEDTPEMSYPINNIDDLYTFYKYNFQENLKFCRSKIQQVKNASEFEDITKEKIGIVRNEYIPDKLLYDPNSLTQGAKFVKKMIEAMNAGKFIDPEVTFNKIARIAHRYIN